MKIFRFHPNAERQFIFLSPPVHGGTGEGSPSSLILTLYRKPPEPVTAFLQRWAPELHEAALLPPFTGGQKGGSVPLTPAFFAAFCLASSGGKPDYYAYARHLSGFLREILPGDNFFQGEKREVFAEHGICALPLPIARQLAGDVNLKPANLHQPQLSFTLARAWANIFAGQFYGMQNRVPNILEIALTLRCTNISQYRSNNPYRISFPGSFLPDFLGYYNTAAILLNPNPKDTDHASRQTDHRVPPDSTDRADGTAQQTPGNQ